MSRSPGYRDDYEGRGKYAKENEAMLRSEQLRLTDWEAQSTRYRGTLWPLLAGVAVSGLAAVILALIAWMNG